MSHLILDFSNDTFSSSPLKIITYHTQHNDFGVRFRCLSVGTLGKDVVSAGKTQENGRKMEAGIRWSYAVAGTARLLTLSAGSGKIQLSDPGIGFLLPSSYHLPLVPQWPENSLKFNELSSITTSFLNNALKSVKNKKKKCEIMVYNSWKYCVRKIMGHFCIIYPWSAMHEYRLEMCTTKLFWPRFHLK